MNRSHPPKMDTLIEAAAKRGLEEKYGRVELKRSLQQILDGVRRSWKAGGEIPSSGEILARVEALLAEAFQPPLHPVINGTGIVLHTNLGRAPLSAAHLREASELLQGYLDLELDLSAKSRGHRDLRLERSVQRLFDTDYGVVVVNNNAAAVLLVLNTLSMGRETIVSRGELIEIGGSFRIPEVMAASGAVLREVGTTNRTRLKDYAGAIGPESGLILKVHPSNFEISGFTEETPLEDLAGLGREKGIPVAFDLGSGFLLPEGTLDVGGEPSVRSALDRGVDIICFSADKLMGASQGGVILVSPEHIRAFRSNHLLRALRVDKVSYLLLGRAVEAFRKGCWEEIPALRMLAAPVAALRRRAGGLMRRVEGKAPGAFRMEVVLEEGRVGAGSAPTHGIPSPALAVKPIRGSVSNLDGYLRGGGSHAVMGVVADNRLLLHMRTIFSGQAKVLAERLAGYPAWLENQKSKQS